MAKSNDKKISTKEIENFLLDEEVRLCMDWGKERNPFTIIEPGEVQHSRILYMAAKSQRGTFTGGLFH